MAFGMMAQRRRSVFTPHASRFGTAQANPSDPYDQGPNWNHPMAQQTFGALAPAIRGMIGQSGATRTLPGPGVFGPGGLFGPPSGARWQTLPHRLPMPGTPEWGQPQQGYTQLAQNFSGNPIGMGESVQQRSFLPTPPQGMAASLQARSSAPGTIVGGGIGAGYQFGSAMPSRSAGYMPQRPGPFSQGTGNIQTNVLPQMVPGSPNTHPSVQAAIQEGEQYRDWRFGNGTTPGVRERFPNYRDDFTQSDMPMAPLSPQDQATIDRQRQYDQSSDPLGAASSYDRFRPGGAFGQPTPTPQHQQQELPTGTTMSGGSMVIHRPDGREVLLPPGMSRDVYANAEGGIPPTQGALDASGMREYRREASERAARGDFGMQRALNAGDKGIAYRGYNLSPESMARYRANRENRPLAGYSTPMTPDQRAAIQAEAPNARRRAFGLSPVTFDQNKNGSNPTTSYQNKPIAERQAAFENSASSPVIASMQEQGFDPVGSSVHETMIGYRQGNENWSDADRQEFEKYLKSRYEYDTEFRKEMDGYLENDTVYSDDQFLAEKNEYRRMFGKPPLKTTEPPVFDRGGGFGSF